MEKSCSTCKRTKPLDQFNRNKNHKDGHAYDCRDCSKGKLARYRKENPEAKAEYMREYQKKNQDRLREYANDYARKLRQETKRTATNNGKRWTEDEDTTVLRADLSLTEISKIVGRTYGSCAVRRTALLERQERLNHIRGVQDRITNA